MFVELTLAKERRLVALSAIESILEEAEGGCRVYVKGSSQDYQRDFYVDESFDTVKAKLSDQI